MFLTAGNALVNPHVGLLFIDFEERKRLRLNGIAEHRRPTTRCWPAYPEAQFLWRVRATRGVPELPALHPPLRARRALPLRAEGDCETPVPEWKRRDWARDVLAADDPANSSS